MGENEDRDIHWTNQLEDLIAREGERCQGLSRIHQQASQETGRKNTRLMLPVNVLSTLSGSASVGSASLFGDENSRWSSIVIGLVIITVGILNTINSYFGYAKKAEAHRIAYLHYIKLFTWVNVELSLPRGERMGAKDMLKQLRGEMDRLGETTPTPPQHLFREFERKFKKVTDVSKPLETNGLIKINPLRKDTAKQQSPASASASPPNHLISVRVPDLS